MVHGIDISRPLHDSYSVGLSIRTLSQLIGQGTCVSMWKLEQFSCAGYSKKDTHQSGTCGDASSLHFLPYPSFTSLSPIIIRRPGLEKVIVRLSYSLIQRHVWTLDDQHNEYTNSPDLGTCKITQIVATNVI